MVFADPTLYLITDRTLARGRSTVEVVRQALAGGVDVVQLREKEAEAAFIIEEGLRIHDLTVRYNVPLIINDRVDIALAIEAEGVHVGQTDLPAALARKLLSTPRILGVSTSTAEMARRAQEEGADYIGFGPIYPTATKVTAATPRGIQMIQTVQKAANMPLVALGGISQATIAETVAAGADHIAVCSAIVAAEDIQRAAATLKETLEKARARRRST